MSDHVDCNCDASASSANRSDDLTRRGFLGLSLSGYLGLSLGGASLLAPRFGRADEGSGGLPGKGQAQHVIFLWLNGGPSHLDTFDPKPGHKNQGPVRAINTSVKGVQLSEHFPRLAEEMGEVALIRSMSTREGNHQRARYYLHTGYVPSGTVKHPDLGSLICQQKADQSLDLPSYITIAGATPGPGILGVSLAPFTVQDPTKPVENLDYGRGVDQERFDRRRKLRQLLSKEFADSRPGPEVEGHESVYEKADQMMHSKRREAFEVSREPEAIRTMYGSGKFGTGCLMARRLIEQGVKVVEVQLNGWDTHRDNFTKVGELGGQLDQGFSALIKDLRRRELLDQTLIVCMGEFGRTPRINGNEGRDHFARAWSMAMAGGGVKGGQVIGATSDDGMQVVDSPFDVPQIAASIAHATGLNPEHTNYTPNGRPIYLFDEGGAPIPKLFA